MPPFLTTHCPHCQEKNVFDQAVLEQTDGGTTAKVYRALHPPAQPAQEYHVTCQHCLQAFKVKKTAASDGR
jgi:hypothetical protein